MLPIALALLAGPAEAQESEPSPVARCAAAAHGNEVEICLQLVVAHPDQADGIAAALRAHIARDSGPDQQLLLALLSLVDDSTAPGAADRMAELGDARAIPALVACAEQRPVAVAGACVRAVGQFEGGLSHLDRWLTESGRPSELQAVAARTLGEHGTEAAADVLVDALRQPRLGAPTRRVVLDTIRAAYPDRAPETEGQVASDGRLWLALGGGWGMSFAMGAAGHFGRSELAPLGWTTGAVGGVTAGWLYGRAWPMESGDAAYLTTGAILGTTSGMLLGEGLAPGSGDALYLGGLAGMAVGYGIPVATRGIHPGTGADAVEASAVATATLAVAASAADVATGPTRSRSASPPLLAAGIGLAGGGLVGHVVAPHVDLHPGDAGLIALGSGWGLGVGLLLPVGSESRGALPVLTTAGGALLAYGLAHPVDLPSDVQGAAWAGAAYGGTLGAGVGLLVDPDGYAASPAALGFGTAGMVAAGVLAHVDPEPLDDRDVVLVGAVTAWTGWQAAGWAEAIDVERERFGWFVLAPAAVGGAVALATPEIDVPVTHTVAAASLGLWGAYGAGVGAELAGADPLPASLNGSNVGLVGGALVMSPLVGAPPVVIGVADAGGVLGGSVGALGAALATDQSDMILVSSLVGAGLGFTGGAVLGASWKKGGTRDMAWMPRTIPGHWLVRPDMGPRHTGVAVEVTAW